MARKFKFALSHSASASWFLAYSLKDFLGLGIVLGLTPFGLGLGLA